MALYSRSGSWSGSGNFPSNEKVGVGMAVVVPAFYVSGQLPLPLPLQLI